jgi:Ca2+-binding RTX toxin-like protein
MTGTYQNYLAELGAHESSGRWDFVNPIGHAGYYQVIEASLRMIGYYDYDGTAAVDWNGGWTDKARAEGINSLQDFLANHAFQDKSLTEYYQYLWDTNFEGSNLKEFIGQTIGGITITESGLFAGSHLVGANGVEAFLRSGGVAVSNDPFGTTVSSYLSKFGGYDMSPVTGTHTSSPTEVVTAPPATTPISVPAGQVLEGTEDHDALFGGQLGDTINGKNGNDWMNGRGGNDHLWGGHGTDMFAFAEQFGDDTIEDFQAGAASDHDFITFTSDHFASFADVMANTSDTADGALITSHDGSVLLKGVLKSALVEADFYFI